MSLNRRTVLTGAVMSAAAAALNSPAVAQAVPAAEQAPGFYRYKLGDITVTAINDGYGERPLEGFIRNADLAAVTKAAEDEFFPSKNNVRITFTSLVLQTRGKTVLIDVGNGDLGAPTTGRWMSNFRAAGFDPAKVDMVLISHFHGDHINGLRLKDGSEVFANAEVLVGTEEWDFWMDDGRMSRAPEAMQGAFRNVRRVFGPMSAKLGRYQGGKEVAPGVTAVSAFGHSPGHTCFVIASGAAKLMMMSDVTNHPGLFVRNPDWSAVFDMDADTARATRRRMLDMVATERLQTAFYHAPFPATGFVAKDGAGFRFVPAQWS